MAGRFSQSLQWLDQTHEGKCFVGTPKTGNLSRSAAWHCEVSSGYHELGRRDGEGNRLEEY